MLRIRVAPVGAELVVGAAAALALLPAAAAARWSSPATLTAQLPAPGDAAAQVAISPTGRTLVVWTRGAGVVVSAGDRRGRFSARRTVTRRGGSPHVAIAADGSALIAWTRGGRIWVAARSSGGRIGRARAVSAPARRGVDGPYLAMTRGGTAAAIAWTASGRIGVTWAALRVAGRIGAPQRLGAGHVDAFAADPVSMGPAGDAAVAFERPAASAGQGNVLRIARRRAAAASFDAPSTVGGPPATEPALAAEDTGDVTAAWIAGLGFESDFDGPLMVAAAARDLPFGAPAAGPAQRAFLPHVASLGSGASVIAWQNRVHGTRPSLLNGPIATLARRADGTLGAPSTLDSNVRARRLHVAPLGSIRALAVWTTTPAGSRRLVRRAAVVGSDGVFASVPAPSGRSPSFALDEDLATAGRYAALVWQDGRRLRATVGHL
jgi:hypothetical protein